MPGIHGGLRTFGPTASRHTGTRRLLARVCLVWVLALCAWLLAAQQTPTIAVDVKVVNVLATVRDKHGEIVAGLTKDDFVLEEDGRPQQVRYFAQQSDLPLTLGLLVDTSLSQRRVLDQERSASDAFLYQLMREEKDKAFLVHFDSQVELLKDLTGSRAQLHEALDEVETSSPERENRAGGWPGGGGGGRHGGGGGGGGGHAGGGTLLYDAVFLSADELMSKQRGRKAVIILSDGVDQGSKLTLARAIEAAERADTLVYSILFADPDAYGLQDFGRGRGGWPGGGRGGRGGGGWPGGGRGGPSRQESRPDGKKILQQLARETGGRFFEVSKKEPIDKIYAAIEEDLRNQYNLGYSSDRTAAAAPGYRKIKVTTNRKDILVQARDGYYPEQTAGR